MPTGSATHGLAVRKSRAAYVRQARQLVLHAVLDQPEYRPGAKAKITLTLTDPDGKATPGAIGLKAVDEAVFAVLSQKSGLEQTFFLLEQELLEPVYAIYPGWSPDLFTELPFTDRSEFEQALFSTTAQRTEGPRAIPYASSARSRGRRGLSAVTEMPAGCRGGATIRPCGRRVRSARRSRLPPRHFPQKVQEVMARRQRRTRPASSSPGGRSPGRWRWWGCRFRTMRDPEAFVITLAIALLSCCVLGVVSSMLMLTAIQCRTQSACRDCARLWTKSAVIGGAERTAADSSQVPRQSQTAAAPPRLRQWFPETLLWRPELITDDKGQATLDVDLADSITTWRLTRQRGLDRTANWAGPTSRSRSSSRSSST